MVTYQGDSLTHLTYQLNAESGDWILIDELTRAGDELNVRRTTLFAEGGYKVIHEGVIHADKAGPLRFVSITRADGKPAKPTDVDDVNYPNLPVHAPGEMPFVAIMAEMRARPSALCAGR
jgi:hypothetical protein